MIGVNLIDVALLTRRRRLRRIRRWAAIIVLTGLVGTVPAGVEYARERRLHMLNKDHVALRERIGAAQVRLNGVSADVRAIESQIARANALRSKRSWSRLLGHIGEILPEQMWLVSVSTDPARPTRGDRDYRPKEADDAKNKKKKEEESEEDQVIRLEAPERFQFEGYALEHRHLYEFIESLKRGGHFSDVQITKAAEEPVLTGRAVRFKIECRW